MLHLFLIGCIFRMVTVYMMPIREELLVPISMKEWAHGYVNLPPKIASLVYKNIETGMPQS